MVRAVEQGDREAMFALAMLQLHSGAAAIANKGQSCSPPRRNSVTPRPLQSRPAVSRGPDASAKFFGPRGDSFRGAAQAASRKPNTRSQPRRGVDLTEAVRLGAASGADNTDACHRAVQRNGGAEHEIAAGGSLSESGAKCIPIAQNRLVIFLRSAACAGIRWTWHIIAKASSVSDIPLDTFMQSNTAPRRRREGGKALAGRVSTGRASHALDVAGLRRQTLT